MKYHRIDVDEEVWAYLQSKAQPLVDTANSVLRGVLFGEATGVASSTQPLQPPSSMPSIPGNIPRALSQILEVIYEVKKMGRLRTEATGIVARRRGTTPQTILDKYCRQLNKKAYQIDELLEQNDLADFEDILKKKFARHLGTIEPFFQNLRDADSLTVTERDAKLKPVKQAAVVQIDKAYTLEELKRIDIGKETRPTKLELNAQAIYVKDWTHLCVKFVEWLINEGFLTASKVPILNHAQNKKYFINTERKHRFSEKDAEWKRVGDFFVDTKYNADAHVKNIRRTLQDLGCTDVDLKITFSGS